MRRLIKRLLPSVATQSPDLRDLCSHSGVCVEVPSGLMLRTLGKEPQSVQLHIFFRERNDTRFPASYPTPGVDLLRPTGTEEPDEENRVC